MNLHQVGRKGIPLLKRASWNERTVRDWQMRIVLVCFVLPAVLQDLDEAVLRQPGRQLSSVKPCNVRAVLGFDHQNMRQQQSLLQCGQKSVKPKYGMSLELSSSGGTDAVFVLLLAATFS